MIDKILIFCAITTFTLNGICSFGQSERFIGIIDNNLVEVNPFTPDLKLIAEIDVPIGAELRRGLAYHPLNCLFYYIFEGGTNPQLASIDFEGNFNIIGEITYPNGDLSIAEGIAYNSLDNELYITGSLDGFDFGSETLFTIDVNTLELTFITSIETQENRFDVDNMVFEDNILYFNDIDPGPAITKFYSFDITNVAPTVNLFSILTIQSDNSGDVAILDGYLYFALPTQEFARFDLQNPILDIVGPFSTLQFNNQELRGLEYINDYIEINYQGDIGEDFSICNGESITIGFDSGGYDILWSTGETTDSISVTQPGVYSAQIILNDCPIFTSNTINVSPGDFVTISQEIEICENEAIDIFGTEISEAGNFEIMIPSMIGCDTILNLNVELTDLKTIVEDYAICADDELFIDTLVITSPGVYSYRTNGNSNCDTLFIIDVTQINVPVENFEIRLCNSEPVEINNITYSVSGSFTQTLVSTTGCDSTLLIEVINEIQLPTTLEAFICDGLSVSINAETYDSAGTFSQILTSVSGCDSLINIVVNQSDIYIPNVFSPKLEGNDTFGPFIPCDIDFYEFYIYDRWGNLVFQSLEKDEFWNGTYDGSPDLVQGIYTYMIRYGNVNSLNLKSGNVLMLL